jgi:DNA polymerase V
MDLQPGNVHQQELDLESLAATETAAVARDRSQLMSTMDAINVRYGKGTVHSVSNGRTGPERMLGMKQERKTPQYMSRLEDVPVARA